MRTGPSRLSFGRRETAYRRQMKGNSVTKPRNRSENKLLGRNPQCRVIYKNPRRIMLDTTRNKANSKDGHPPRPEIEAKIMDRTLIISAAFRQSLATAIDCLVTLSTGCQGSPVGYRRNVRVSRQPRTAAHIARTRGFCGQSMLPARARICQRRDIADPKHATENNTRSTIILIITSTDKRRRRNWPCSTDSPQCPLR
jgi:hypothetical protein